MKKSLISFAIILLGIISSVGCGRTEKVRAYEGVVDDRPYTELGSLEVSAPAKTLPLKKVFWSGAEVATLTVIDSPSRAELYKAHLRAKLAARAKKVYGANAVINVEYWPDPASTSFPDGLVHAKGLMVRYQKFPPQAEPISSAK